jgi:hypothetical protein
MSIKMIQLKINDITNTYGIDILKPHLSNIGIYNQLVNFVLPTCNYEDLNTLVNYLEFEVIKCFKNMNKQL